MPDLSKHEIAIVIATLLAAAKDVRPLERFTYLDYKKSNRPRDWKTTVAQNNAAHVTASKLEIKAQTLALQHGLEELL